MALSGLLGLLLFHFQLVLPKFASSIRLHIHKTDNMFPFDVQIEELKKDEYEIVAAMLTDAFESNPAYTLIFTKKDKLRKGLFWLFKANGMSE